MSNNKRKILVYILSILIILSFNFKAVKAETLPSKVWEYNADVMVWCIAADSNGYIYSGGFDGNVTKIFSGNTKVWEYTTGGEYVFAVAVDKNGYVYSGDNSDMVTKISPNGTKIWEYNVSTPVYGVVVDKDGYVYSGDEGGNVIKLSPSGDMVWSKSALSGISGLAIDSNGCVYSGDSSGCLMKISPSGTVIWTYKADDLGGINSLAVDSNGNIYCGDASNKVTKISPSGTKVWEYDITETVYGLAVNDSGYVYVGGNSTGVTKISPSGIKVWNYTGVALVLDVIIDNNGFVYVSGVNTETMGGKVVKILDGDSIVHEDPSASEDGSTTSTATSESSLSLSLSTNSINFGHVSPLTLDYDLGNMVTATVQSNSGYSLSCKAQDDFKTSGGDIITIDHLKAKLNSNGTWLTISKTVPIELQDNLPATSGASSSIDFRLDTSWTSFKTGDYSADISIIASTM